MNNDHASAQTLLITRARTDIVNAFQALQTAEHQGASNSDLIPLINQLNLALQFEVNATAREAGNDTQGAASDALQSINLSTSVSLQAQKLGDAAQTASLGHTATAYSIAILIAVVAALLLVESPRIIRKLRNRQLRRIRIDYGGEKSAK